MSNPPFTVWPVNGLEKVFADARPPAAPARGIELGAVGGECEVAQIAVHAAGDDLILHAPVATDLRDGDRVIDADHITCRFVDLVPARFNTQGVPPDQLLRAAPCYFPDPLCLEDRIHIPGGQSRAIWVRVDVPRDAAPGDYRGTVTVATDRGETNIDVKLTVWPISLPDQIPFSMTLWVWPFIIAKYHCVRLYSDEFWDLLKVYAAEMAAHRQDTIFTTIVGPDALIDVTRTRDGGYRFDFANFDRWVEIFFDAGFRTIEGSHVYDDSIRFVRIFDEASGSSLKIRKDGTVKDFVADDEYMTMAGALIGALRDHLHERAWADRYLQHVFDEPMGDSVPVYLEMARTLREIWPEVKLIDAADADPALFDAIDFLVPLIDNRTVFKDPDRFRAAGKTLWAYTSNYPRAAFPGTFLDMALIKVRILPWLMWRYGITGYLYYALGYWEVQFPVDRHRFDPYGGETDDSITLYNPWLDPAQNATWRCPPGSWGFCYPPRDPYSQDPRILAPHLVENFDRWRAGDGSDKKAESPLADRMKTLPGVVGSIRWEQLREGIDDYRLLWMLRDEIAKAEPGAAGRAQHALDAIIAEVAPDWQNFTRDPAAIDRARREVVDQIINLRNHG